MITVEQLPALNAILNGICTILLLMGYRHIRAGRITAHRRTMITAFAVSVIFLISYVVYHAQVGSKGYPGHGILRAVYFSILIPHIVFAATLVPLVLVTLRRGLARNDAQHRRIARITFPIWLYVSVTGVIVYAMLYL